MVTLAQVWETQTYPFFLAAPPPSPCSRRRFPFARRAIIPLFWTFYDVLETDTVSDLREMIFKRRLDLDPAKHYLKLETDLWHHDFGGSHWDPEGVQTGERTQSGGGESSTIDSTVTFCGVRPALEVSSIEGYGAKLVRKNLYAHSEDYAWRQPASNHLHWQRWNCLARWARLFSIILPGGWWRLAWGWGGSGHDILREFLLAMNPALEHLIHQTGCQRKAGYPSHATSCERLWNEYSEYMWVLRPLFLEISQHLLFLSTSLREAVDCLRLDYALPVGGPASPVTCQSATW